jgi:ubiquinone/menaquinone biosynthesis C-methylase UbiE
MAVEEAERIARERDYHNQRFEDNSEREGRTRRFYDAISYGFDLYRQRVHEASAGRVVLEYGCGIESLAFDLAEARQVLAIDISDVAIVQAQRTAQRKGLKNVDFSVDNAEAMHFEDGSVDVVAGSGIVHHLDIPKSMREVKRVLRPGGVAIFTEPMGHNPVVNWYRNRTPELRTPDEHPLLAGDLRDMARGFKSSRVTYFGLVAPLLGLLGREVRAGSPLTRLVWWLDRQLCRIPVLNKYSWFSVIELHA